MGLPVVILIGIALAAATAFVGARTDVAVARVVAVGDALGLALWGVMAIGIYRGGDNPDLGETGWTIVVGILIGIWVAAWILGVLVGRALRRRST